MEREVLVIGSTAPALQAAQDLADCGLEVQVVESCPFIGGAAPPDLPDYLHNVRLLEILKHPRITVWTNTEIRGLEVGQDGFQAELYQHPRFVDLDRCTACGACLAVCPVIDPGTGLTAIHFGGQPEVAVISKQGISPCSKACPAGIHVQGYVALAGQGRYREAYDLIQEALPFPSVCGRVCNHYCEESCTRGILDDPVSIMALKRFIADWAYQHPDQVQRAGEETCPEKTGKQVAIIGAGPAGLTAARDLVRLGHEVTVFDDHPKAGGMMRVGIPPHRLPYTQLDWEIDRIVAEGVDLRLNTRVDDIPGLFGKGYQAVLIATGAHLALKNPLEGADHPDNWLSLDFLKKVCLGQTIDLNGRSVIVLGGGDVAMDAARSALRLGASAVKILCRGLRASFNEIQEAEEEGVEIIKDRVFQRVVLDKRAISGVECKLAEVGEVVDGKRQFTVLPGTEHLVSGDLVIWALGQKPDFSFLPQDGRISLSSPQGILADERMMTTMEGVFTAGDVRRGTTFFVVDAVGEGHRAADAIDLFLTGSSSAPIALQLEEVLMTPEEAVQAMDRKRSAGIQRAQAPRLPVEKRRANFHEVDLPLDEESVFREASRCLACGPCSECMACVEVCQPGAVIHQQQGRSLTRQVAGVILADGLNPELDLPELIRISGEDPLAGSAAAFPILAENNTLPRLLRERYPPAAEQSREGNPAIGLVLCRCGDEISGKLDLGKLCAAAGSWPEISYAGELPFSCTSEGKNQLEILIREHKLEAVILGACSCCALDQVCYSCTYQRLRCKDNLGIFSSLIPLAQIEFINIREQCAWAHPGSRVKATDAAELLIRAALARVRIPVNQKTDHPEQPPAVLILGKGSAAAAAGRALAQLGLAAETMDVLSGDILRTGGQFLVPGQEGDVSAEALILAPGSGAELDYLLAALKLDHQRPFLPQDFLGRDSLDYGLLICPPDLEPEASGRGAAVRAQAWIKRRESRISRPAAEVDRQRCRSCGTCQDVCGYGIPALLSDDIGTYAWVDPSLCFDCGACTAHCPSGAITPGTNRDDELKNILEEILTGYG